MEGDPVVSGAPRSAARTALMAIIAVALVLIGGGLAVALGIGRDPVPAADSVDAGFSRDMSRHHLQGVEMANLVADRSEDPEVELLAFDIASTQNNQAGRMQGWLDLWGAPLTGGGTMAWMGEDHAHDTSPYDPEATDRGANMPGMATDRELADLRALSGAEFDVEFLRLMIRHHQGGFEMAEYAAEHADVAEVRDLARGIAQSQATETRYMLDLLTTRGGTPLPEP
jgi:uncharacterized protein (DUF305 family)